MKNRTLYLKKVDLIMNVLALHKKKVLPADVYAEGKKLGLSNATALRAWKNFVETGGRIDLRVNDSMSTSSRPQFATKKRLATKKNQNITTQDAGRILKDWLAERKQSIDEFCLANNISVNQFYEWIHELNIAGTLLGRTILDPKKYAKLDVKVAISLTKNVNTQRKEVKQLTPMQRYAYYRFADILQKYL